MKKKVKVPTIAKVIRALKATDLLLEKKVACSSGIRYLKLFGSAKEAWETSVETAKVDSVVRGNLSWMARELNRLVLSGSDTFIPVCPCSIPVCPCSLCCLPEDRAEYERGTSWKAVRGPLMEYCRKFDRKKGK
jgi:hypothetical protein